MIKVICDICGRVMEAKGENTINLDFNAYESGMSRLKKLVGSQLDTEYNLCPVCAEKVYKFIKEEQEKERTERFLIMEGGKLEETLQSTTYSGSLE